MSAEVFWLTKSLNDMTTEQWESLCDGCGKCCLHKLEDEDTGDIYGTDVACRYLDLDTCRCKDYVNRKALVPACTQLTIDHIDEFIWLPTTCAYRLVAEGSDLPDWHPLKAGDRMSIHQQGKSLVGRAISEEDVDPEDMENHIVRWVD